jgi:crossover junction endodeoxyribonuclease RusA
MNSDPIKLVLPYPISANRYWRTFMPKGFKAPVTTLSQEAKSYKSQVQWMCKAAGIKSPISGRVHIDIKLYPHRPQDYAKRMQKLGARWDDDVKCIDLDNANKVLFDAIKGIAIEDDKWVRRLTSERMEPDDKEARVVMTITAIEIEEPQGSLL